MSHDLAWIQGATKQWASSSVVLSTVFYPASAMMTCFEVSFHCILVEVLYVRVDGGEHESSSLLCARSEDWRWAMLPTWFASLDLGVGFPLACACQGHAKWLLSGVPIEGAVKVGENSKKFGFARRFRLCSKIAFCKGVGITTFRSWMSPAVCGVQEAGRYDRYRFFACLPCLAKIMVIFHKNSRRKKGHGVKF